MSQAAPAGGAAARKAAWGFVAVVALLHYDFWFWGDTSLVFGFVPVGLAYQAAISVLAAIGWALVVRFAWPTHIEEWADEPGGQAAPGPSEPHA